MSRSLVIDTDTASDDAVALMLAAADPHTEIRAVTVVAGNVPLERGVRNAKITLELMGRADVPLWAGCAKPLTRELGTAQHVHGEDGMGGVPLPDPTMPTQPGHAVTALLELAQAEPGRHTLVTLGPLTNVAAAITIDPDFLTRFAGTVMMIGTADGWGNVTPIGEYNAWADPEAAAIVFGAVGEKTMVGWDVSRKDAVVDPEEDARLRAHGRRGRFASEINADVNAFAIEETGLAGYDLPDPITMAVALDEGLIRESHDWHMLVSTDEGTRGHTYGDHRTPPRPANVRVVTEVDRAGFLRRLHDAMREDAA